jgi:hypothetical protein
VFGAIVRRICAADSRVRENRLKEKGWDGEVSEKSLAIRPFSLREEADLAPSLGHSSHSGWEKFKKQAQAEAVGCTMARYGRPKRKFQIEPLL